MPALARVTGYDLGWLKALEHGWVDPRLGSLVYLAGALDVNLEHLLR